MTKKKWMMKKIDHDEAIKEGLEQGSNSKAIEIAKKMLKENMKISDISRLTGLDEKTIQSLK